MRYKEKPDINGIEIVIINYLCVEKKTAVAVNYNNSLKCNYNNISELMSQQTTEIKLVNLYLFALCIYEGCTSKGLMPSYFHNCAIINWQNEFLHQK